MTYSFKNVIPSTLSPVISVQIMDLQKLPMEVFAQILSYLPSDTLRNLYDILEFSNEWKALVVAELYGHISTDPERQDEKRFRVVSPTEFHRLASGRINVQVQHLEIIEEDSHFEEFLKFYRSFLERIPKITFSGDEFGYNTYDSLIRTHNLVEIDIDIIMEWRFTLNSGQEVIHFNELPFNLEILTVYSVDSDITLKELPETIKSISVIWKNGYSLSDIITDGNSEDSDDSDNEHEGFRGTVSDWELPDNLSRLSLSLFSKEGLKLPRRLTHLSLRACGIEAMDIIELKLPKSLKELELDNNPIKDLSGVTFPPLLEILSLENCGIESLTFTKFPESLKSLNISHNSFQGLKNVTFPKLKVLNIWSPEPFSLSNVSFPETIERLKVRLPNFEWKDAYSLANLKALDVSLDEGSLVFPSDLEELTLRFDKKVCSLKLPQSIQRVSVYKGEVRIFEQDLYSLQELCLENLNQNAESDEEGKVRVP